MLKKQKVYVLWCMREGRGCEVKKPGKLPGGMKSFEAGPGCGFRGVLEIPRLVGLCSVEFD